MSRQRLNRLKQGSKVGRWTVLEVYRDGLNSWCVCECGVTKKVNRGTLVTQGSRSCGCLQRDVQTKNTSGWDWSQKNNVLAVEKNLSRERIRQLRVIAEQNGQIPVMKNRHRRTR